MKKIYIGCSLSHSTEEFRNSIDALKAALREKYEVLEFFGLGAGEPQAVFKKDYGQVKSCDLLLAECSHPSTGLGVEVGLAISLNKPILAIAQPNSTVSRMITGIDHPKFNFLRYTSIDEVIKAVEEKMTAL